MHDATRQLEQATWAVAEGRATAEERALLEADPAAWRRTLDRLIATTEASLASVRGLSGPERERVVADFEDDLARLHGARGAALATADGTASAEELAEVMGRVQLQASWSAGQVVVWAGGPGTGLDHQRRPRRSARSGRRARRRAGACTLTSCCRRARGPRRWPSPCGSRWAGWSRGERPQPARTSARACLARAGRPARRAPGGRRRGRPDPAHQSARPTAGAVESSVALGAGAGRRGGARRRWPPPCPAPSSPSHRPRRGPRRWPCSARSSTPSSARRPAGWSCRRLRRRPTPPRAVAEAFTHPARRLHLPGPGRPGRPGGPPARAVVAGSGHVAAPAPPRRAARSAGRRRRLVPLGARPGGHGQPAADRGGAERRRPAPEPLADELVRLERLLPVLHRARQPCAGARSC